MARRPFLGGLHASTPGALARRHSDHRRGRDLHLRHPEDQGLAQLCLLLSRRAQGREDRRTQGPLHVPRQQQQGVAADPRSTPRPAVEMVGRPRLRECLARDSAGQRALPRRELRRRPLHRLPPGRGLVGEGPLDESGPQQLRRHPLRVLSRRHGAVRGLQGGRARRPAGEHRAQLGDRLRHPASARRPDPAGRDPARTADRHAVLRFQHPPRLLQGPARA